MIGIFFIIFATFFQEVSTVIGKVEFQQKKETIYTFGFLSVFWTMIWFAVIILFRQSFNFSIESIPTLFVRMVLEILLIEVALRAITKSDRTTDSIGKSVTIPLLLISDLLLGYTLSGYQVSGVILLGFAILSGVFFHKISKVGLPLVLTYSVMAVGTTSLYKYNITNYNGVEAEQFIVYLIMMFYLLLRLRPKHITTPFKLLLTRPFSYQAIGGGLSGVLGSFAFLFAPASVIIAAKRSLAILWAIISGNLFFKEKHLYFKIAMLVILSFGIVLLTRS